MSERRDWLVYVTPKFNPNTKKSAASFDPRETYASPQFYPTSSSYLWNHIKPGDRVWMLGCPRIAGRTLAPGIDGILVVKKAHEAARTPAPLGPASIVSDRRYWFEAGPGSAWFPWAAASDLLPTCPLVRKDGSHRFLPGRPPEGGENGRGWWNRWGNLLRPGSAISASAAHKIEAHVKVLKNRSVFISYAWADGALLAARLAEILSDKGYAVWLDRFSAPRQMAFGLATVRSEALGPFLAMALDSCGGFAQIRTEGARRKARDGSPASWCLHEREEARSRDLPGADITVDFGNGLKQGPVTADQEKALLVLTDLVLGEMAG